MTGNFEMTKFSEHKRHMRQLKKKIFSWVVTAAHCLNRTAKAFFGLNEDGSFTDMRVIPTGDQFVHPGFGERNGMGVNDIGESFKN